MLALIRRSFHFSEQASAIPGGFDFGIIAQQSSSWFNTSEALPIPHYDTSMQILTGYKGLDSSSSWFTQSH